MPKATMPDHGNGSDKDPHTSGGFQHVNPARCGRKRLGQRSKGALLSTTFRSCDITLLALPHVCSACDSLTPPTRVRGTTRTGPLGSSDGRQSPSIAAPKAMPFAGASSHPVVASECIPVAQTPPRCENAVMNTHRRSRTRGTTTCRQVAGWGRMDRTDGKDGTSRAAA